MLSLHTFITKPQKEKSEQRKEPRSVGGLWSYLFPHWLCRFGTQRSTEQPGQPDSQQAIQTDYQSASSPSACKAKRGASQRLSVLDTHGFPQSQTYTLTHTPYFDSLSFFYSATQTRTEQSRTLLCLPIPQSSDTRTPLKQKIAAQLAHPLPRGTAPPECSMPR